MDQSAINFVSLRGEIDTISFGMLLLQVVASLAQMERESKWLGVRTKAGLQAVRERAGAVDANRS